MLIINSTTLCQVQSFCGQRRNLLAPFKTHNVNESAFINSRIKWRRERRLKPSQIGRARGGKKKAKHGEGKLLLLGGCRRSVARCSYVLNVSGNLFCSPWNSPLCDRSETGLTEGFWCSFNLLKPTGHAMHQQFNIQQLYVLPTLYLCVLYLSENKERLVPLTV